MFRRTNGRPPLYLIGGLTIVVVFLSISYWNLNTQNNDVLQSLEKMQASLKIEEVKIAQSERKTSALQDELHRNEDVIKKLEEKLSSLEQVVQNCNNNLNKRENEITLLKDQADELQGKLREADIKIGDLESDNEKLIKENEMIISQKDDAITALDKRDEQIIELTRKVQQLQDNAAQQQRKEGNGDNKDLGPSKLVAQRSDFAPRGEEGDRDAGNEVGVVAAKPEAAADGEHSDAAAEDKDGAAVNVLPAPVAGGGVPGGQDGPPHQQPNDVIPPPPDFNAQGRVRDEPRVNDEVRRDWAENQPWNRDPVVENTESPMSLEGQRPNVNRGNRLRDPGHNSPDNWERYDRADGNYAYDADKRIQNDGGNKWEDHKPINQRRNPGMQRNDFADWRSDVSNKRNERSSQLLRVEDGGKEGSQNVVEAEPRRIWINQVDDRYNEIPDQKEVERRRIENKALEDERRLRGIRKMKLRRKLKVRPPKKMNVREIPENVDKVIVDERGNRNGQAFKFNVAGGSDRENYGEGERINPLRDNEIPIDDSPRDQNGRSDGVLKQRSDFEIQKNLIQENVPHFRGMDDDDNFLIRSGVVSDRLSAMRVRENPLYAFDGGPEKLLPDGFDSLVASERGYPDRNRRFARRSVLGVSVSNSSGTQLVSNMSGHTLRQDKTGNDSNDPVTNKEDLSAVGHMTLDLAEPLTDASFPEKSLQTFSNDTQDQRLKRRGSRIDGEKTPVEEGVAKNTSKRMKGTSKSVMSPKIVNQLAMLKNFKQGIQGNFPSSDRFDAVLTPAFEVSVDQINFERTNSTRSVKMTTHDNASSRKIEDENEPQTAGASIESVVSQDNLTKNDETATKNLTSSSTPLDDFADPQRVPMVNSEESSLGDSVTGMAKVSYHLGKNDKVAFGSSGSETVTESFENAQSLSENMPSASGDGSKPSDDIKPDSIVSSTLVREPVTSASLTPKRDSHDFEAHKLAPKGFKDLDVSALNVENNDEHESFKGMNSSEAFTDTSMDIYGGPSRPDLSQLRNEDDENRISLLSVATEKASVLGTAAPFLSPAVNPAENMTNQVFKRSVLATEKNNSAVPLVAGLGTAKNANVTYAGTGQESAMEAWKPTDGERSRSVEDESPLRTAALTGRRVQQTPKTTWTPPSTRESTQGTTH